MGSAERIGRRASFKRRRAISEKESVCEARLVDSVTFVSLV